jgi:DnaJ-domain-containing protein 1
VLRKTTKEQRERLRVRRAESRARARNRIAEDAHLACYLYLASADGEITGEEIRFLEREFDSIRSLTPPSKDSLSRKVRSLLIAAPPSLQERRRLSARLREFALCDRPLTAHEEEALRVIEDLLEVSRDARRSARRGWGSSSHRAQRGDGEKEKGDRERTSHGKESRRSRLGVKHQPPQTHWSFEYLGCSESDTDDVIKKSYRRLAVKLHPDKHAAKEATPEQKLSQIRAFQKLQEAYEEVWRLRSKSASKSGATSQRARQRARPRKC